MPPYTTLRDFISALASGDTNITRVLELLANDGKMKTDPAASADIGRPNSFDQLPEWFNTACIQRGMTQPEVNHIAAWPNPQKETVRSQIAAAWSENRPIRFGWELHAGDEAASEVRRDPDQTVRVVFRSPRKGVRLTSKINSGNVKVDV